MGKLKPDRPRKCKKVAKMKNITIKIQNANQLVEQVRIVTKDGEPTIIPAQKAVNYEFVDDETGHALQHIVTKRQDNDLHLSFGGNGQEVDVIIQNFYAYKDSALIGLAEEGQYYNYIPDTANPQDYVTELNNGDIEGQALGGKGFAEPWWVAGSSELNVFPFLLGLGFIGGVLAVDANGDDNKFAKILQDFTTTDNKKVAATGLNLATEYTLSEQIEQVLDDKTLSAIDDAKNLTTDVSPVDTITDNTLPTLDNADDIIVVTDTDSTPATADETEVVMAVDVNYSLYHDVTLPVVIDTETPII